MPGMRIAVRADFTRRSISEKLGSVAAGWANPAHSGRKRRINRFTENFQPSRLSDLEIRGVHNAIFAKIFFKKIEYRAVNAFDGLSPTDS
jgi:hypothetical protein